MVIRQDYLNAIKPFVGVKTVKILAGVRRCGKSTIFEMIRNELLGRGVAEERIIMRIYTSMEVDDGFTARDMYEEIKRQIKESGKYYLLLDEVQEIDGWEKVVNTFLEGYDTDIYVTGSNSKLMSAELSTYLTGRFVQIPVYTLSFKEYLQFKENTNQSEKELIKEYIRLGGFPLVASGNFDSRSAYQIVYGIYSTAITRDIAKRHRIKNQALFDRVVKYIVENMGKTFSANSIVNFLKGERRTLSVETIYNYLKWLEEAFIIYPCSRYDLQGKAVLKTQEKYYLSDVSFKYAVMGYDRKMEAAAIENIVYLEMKRRGYEVYVGKNETKEIDFVAQRQEEKVYVQVCVRLPEHSERETENLMNLKDHYHKYVVTTDEMDVGNENGIQIVNLADFLLQDRW